MVEDLPQTEEIQNHGADSVQALPDNRDEIHEQASFSAQRESRPHDSRSEPILLNWNDFVRKLRGIIQEELHDQAQQVTFQMDTALKPHTEAINLAVGKTMLAAEKISNFSDKAEETCLRLEISLHGLGT